MRCNWVRYIWPRSCIIYNKEHLHLKLNKHNEIPIRSMKNYTKENFLERLRKADFSDCATYTSLNEACQDKKCPNTEVFLVRIWTLFTQC